MKSADNMFDKHRVRPGPGGLISLGAICAAILTGPNAGLRLIRGDGETEAAFRQRMTEAGEAEPS